MEFVVNSVGREVPKEVAGYELEPFKGSYARPPLRRFASSPSGFVRPGDSKVLGSIEEAIRASGLRDGMTVSFHHHLRNGDYVLNEVMEVIARMGYKNLKLAPSALFPVHSPVIDHVRSGVITSIEGSMNGPVGEFVSYGHLPTTAVLRSHGGRVRAIHMGDLHIDVAFIAAPECDMYGNANGVNGSNACGSLGLSRADSMYAEKVVMLTDNMVPYPCTPISISQKYVDYVVEMESIGNHEKIVSGTTEVTKDPTRLEIARRAVELIEHSGHFRDGMSYQAGAGGISLACTTMLADLMEDRGYCASFINGGVTQHVVDIYERKLVRKILDGQSFDVGSIRDLRDNPDHCEITPDFYANIYNKGTVVNVLDFVVLGATEVDVDFNVNVNTHSDGLLLHGIGGHQDCAAGAKFTIITVPLFRKTNPVVRERVTTITTPGECVDAIVTEIGVAVNPRNQALVKALEGSPVKLVDISDLKDEAYRNTGKPSEPELLDRVIALIEWRDGTILDCVRQVKEE